MATRYMGGGEGWGGGGNVTLGGASSRSEGGQLLPW